MIKDVFRYNPHISVDCVVFGFDGDSIKVLLIKRKQGEKEVYALPGDLVGIEENLSQAADRILRDLTGLEDIYLRQFKTFGDLNRTKDPIDIEWLNTIRDHPEERVITVAYYSLVRTDDFELKPSSFAEQVEWHPVDHQKKLAFDHNEITAVAWERLRENIANEPKIAFELLSIRFTLTILQNLYESIIGAKLDKRNFRKRILSKKFIVPLDEFEHGVTHKPARYYLFDKYAYQTEFSNRMWFLF